MGANKELCNGWKNRQTWNIALWVSNDESLYFSAIEYKAKCERNAVSAVFDGKPTYRGFVAYANLYGKRTPDGYKYDSQALDYRALSELIREL